MVTERCCRSGTATPCAGDRGFFLIELMLVVAIIGVLAAVAIPSFSTYTIRAEKSEAYTLGREAMKNVAAYYDRWGQLPKGNVEAGLPPAKALVGRNVAGIEVHDGTVEVTLAGKAVPKSMKTDTLRFVPVINKEFPTAPLTWEQQDGQAKSRR